MTCPNIAGRWTFYGRPIKDGTMGHGQMQVSIVQNGTELAGRVVQTIDPWTEQPPEDPDRTRGSMLGKVYLSDHERATLIELVRVNDHTALKAIFTGILSPNLTQITGCFVNNGAAHGTFLMQKESA